MSKLDRIAAGYKGNRTRLPRRSEAALQAQARNVLGILGYASLQTGAARKKVTCPKCGEEHYPGSWQGNDPGLPDVLYFRYSETFPAIFIPVEEKGPGTEIRREQQELADAGRYPLCYTVEANIRAVLAAEEAMHEYRLHEERREGILRFLKENEGRLT